MGDWGVGMPQAMYLEEFGFQVRVAFNATPYLVGSVLQTTDWRDVDVRLLLADQEYAAWGFGDPKPSSQKMNARWVSLCMAYSELGRKMTGLPIDFQIDQMSYANEHHKGTRSALGVVPERFRN